MKKTIVFVLTVMMLASIIPAAVAKTTYTDVPSEGWAADAVGAAAEYGLLEGVGDGVFGFGREISRAQFVTVVCRMFGWDTAAPEVPSFSDVPADSWFYGYVETALKNGAVDKGGKFNPNAPITREDMAVMLVRALGYLPLAESASGFDIPFTDVASSRGYIAVACDIGMTNGTSATTFSPSATAKREEAAAMLVRVYEKYIGKTGFLHGFYAFSSYNQRYVTDGMDAVSLGWSNLHFDNERGVWLNTGSAGGNAWIIPQGYEDITTYLEAHNTKAHLNVFMDMTQTVTLPDGTATSGLKALLLGEENRAAAVRAIMDEATRTYEAIGKSPYGGVTIDFEGLVGADVKAGFTAFLTLLSGELKSQGMSLYVAVQPALADGTYYDGFDCRAIGELADKVILMAHNYNATSLAGFEGTAWHKTTALTPLASVYYSLRAITDSNTGVLDRSKIVLAISFSTIGWEVTEDDKVKSPVPYSPATATVYSRIMQEGTITEWSDTYKNPYMTYTNDEGQRIFLWYEDARSVTEKLRLARLFGINGVSLWRVGTIPDYAGIYDVWNAIG